MDESQLLTIEEAAHLAGVSVATMRRRAAAGAVRATKVGKEWLVEAPSVPVASRSLTTPASGRRSPAVNLEQALVQVRYRDLVELWVPDVLRFEDELDKPVNLLATVAVKLSGPGPFNPVVEVEAPKTPFLSRPAVLLSLTDRVAFHAAVASVMVRIETLRNPAVFSSVASSDPKYLLVSGRDQWLKWQDAAGAALDAGYTWMVKTDISGYFENIQHRLLFADIDALGPEPDVGAAIKRMLGSWATVNGRGIPQGPDASRVLGNLYLIPVDQVMTMGPWRYLRYMDDIRVLARSRREVIEGMRQLQRECRVRGLMLSGDKTAVLVGDSARESLVDSELDAAQYWVDVAPNREGRGRLRRILARALRADGTPNGRHVRFSLYRLWSLRDSASLNLVLRRLEDLASLGSLAPQYLIPFLGRASVQRRLTEFLEDPQRNVSAFLSTWLLAAMVEQPGTIPDAWIGYARRVARDRNQATYHRIIAASLLGVGRRASDITWLRDSVKTEFDPGLLRGYLVALARGSELDRDVSNVAVARVAALEQTVEYLRGRKDLPSLIELKKRVRVR